MCKSQTRNVRHPRLLFGYLTVLLQPSPPAALSFSSALHSRFTRFPFYQVQYLTISHRCTTAELTFPPFFSDFPLPLQALSCVSRSFTRAFNSLISSSSAAISCSHLEREIRTSCYAVASAFPYSLLHAVFSLYQLTLNSSCANCACIALDCEAASCRCSAVTRFAISSFCTWYLRGTCTFIAFCSSLNVASDRCCTNTVHRLSNLCVV